MKKLLFLIFGVIFALAGCADESGTNGGSSETCPISSADFSYEKISKDSYEIQYQIKLNNTSKREYENNVKWIGGYDRVRKKPFEYSELEPLLIYAHNPSPQKEATFYYNNNQCGDTIILKPISTYKNCDSIIVDYYQDNAYIKENTQEVHFHVKYKGGVDLSLNSELKFNNGFAESRSGTITTSGHQFLVPYSKIQNTIDKNNPKIYADVIIKYPNNEECVKEVEFYLR